MQQYLMRNYDEEITNLLNNPDDLIHVSLNVSLAHLQRKQPSLYQALQQNSRQELPKWDACLVEAQKSLIEGNMFLEPGFQIKQNCHVRFVGMPLTVAQAVRKAGSYPGNDQVGQFLQVKGTVSRMTQSRPLEFKRQYVCTRCKKEIELEALYEESYVFNPPNTCPLANEIGCKGYLQQKSAQPQPDCCQDYQEVRIQEIMSDLNLPATLIITLENDLADSCQPGDCVTVVGTMERRWGPCFTDKRTVVTIAMRANSVSKEENKMTFGKELPEHLVFTRVEWDSMVAEIGELAARDFLVQSICPEIHGMYPVKLAVALSLASCTERFLGSGRTVRGHSHLLLAGDPGLAKSRLLEFASEIAIRSVFTTGIGCSSAGLTATAVQENGEWHLEAGALVLADGGVCCIDEFNWMRETDKGSIHEAMEQQTVSIAKAGLLCKLSTRCVVMAATNPRNLFSMSDMVESSSLGMGGPLLSRFDLVLTLCDSRDPDWDLLKNNHILSSSVVDRAKQKFDQTPSGGHWNLERLQTHFLAIKDFHPKISDDANAVLSAYYKQCRASLQRDQARVTVRLMDSLVRLSQSHARLMFRDEVNLLDAVTVIRLMESSWGFGLVMGPVDLIRSPLPLGPSLDEIERILQHLGLAEAVQKLSLPKQIDKAKIDRYLGEQAAKMARKEAAPVNRLDITQSESDLEEQVLESLNNDKRQIDDSMQVKQNSCQDKRKQLEEGDLYSKYSFTQMKKNTVKKMKTAGPSKNSTKCKPKESLEPNPRLNENLQTNELDSILSNLRQNFMHELSKSTQPAKPGGYPEIATVPRASQPNSNYPLASGKSKTSREESFNAMLDISNLMDDNDEESETVDQNAITTLQPTESISSIFNSSDLFKTKPTQENNRFRSDHDLLVNTIREPNVSSQTKPMTVNKFVFKKPCRDHNVRQTHNASIPNDRQLNSSFRTKPPISESPTLLSTDTSSTTNNESKQSTSRYRFTLSSQKNRTTKPPPAIKNPMLISQPSSDDEFDLDLGIDDNISFRRQTGEVPNQQCTSVDTVEAAPKARRPLSECTLNKIRGFEFVPREEGENTTTTARSSGSREMSSTSGQKLSVDNVCESEHAFKAGSLPEMQVFVTLGEQRDPDEELAFLDAIDL
ncbi:DNA helicase MCM9-like [Wyeomyia smithii]|uniref:DNA helicase MCM9-like n=1 Tax=Wyeomyia smithii TaxID=174621 RepID=UPI002467B750|nr:DNA helicase MCM9-like [Wyeomyia smithii]